MNELEKLKEKMDDLLADIDRLEPGSQERQRAVEDYERLYKLVLDAESKEVEYELKAASIENDEKNRKEQKKDKKVDRIFSTVLAVLSLGAPLLHDSQWLKKCLEFETTGSFTTSIGRGFVQKLTRRK